MKIIDRLDKYIEYKKINDNQITVNCGLSQGLLTKARTGKSDLGKKSIEKILNYYQDLNYAWLLTGEGEMVKSVNPQSYAKQSSTLHEHAESYYSQASGSGVTTDLLNNISRMIQTNERNSISISKMVDTADRDSQTIAHLVDILYQNGVSIPDKLAEKGGLHKNRNSDNTPPSKDRNKSAG